MPLLPVLMMQVDEQKARLELATRQGGVDQASLDRSVSASLDLM